MFEISSCSKKKIFCTSYISSTLETYILKRYKNIILCMNLQLVIFLFRG